jgi:hypothetical protein
VRQADFISSQLGSQRGLYSRQKEKRKWKRLSA